MNTQYLTRAVIPLNPDSPIDDQPTINACDLHKLVSQKEQNRVFAVHGHSIATHQIARELYHPHNIIQGILHDQRTEMAGAA